MQRMHSETLGAFRQTQSPIYSDAATSNTLLFAGCDLCALNMLRDYANYVIIINKAIALTAAESIGRVGASTNTPVK